MMFLDWVKAINAFNAIKELNEAAQCYPLNSKL